MSEAPTAAVTVEKLSKSFGQKVVLSDISLEIREGEILAIMGSSGGGKTTLLRCISGLVQPTSGRVAVGDIDVQKDPERARRALGMVFQSAALFDYMSVADNVRFGLKRLKPLTPVERDARMREVLELVGLAEDEDLMPSELSGGMQKRVGIARALAVDPHVMLYDEPTTGLDPITAYTIDKLIVSLRDTLRMTSLLVSHDVSSVFRVADRIAFLDGGHLTFVGSPQEFEKAPNGAIRELVEKASATTFSL